MGGVQPPAPDGEQQHCGSHSASAVRSGTAVLGMSSEQPGDIVERR